MLKAQIIGNLGRDAEVKTLQSGKTVINFSVAHTEKRDGNSKTTWVDCAYWTDKTGIAPYLKKGTQVYVDGIPDVKSFTKQDGTTATTLLITVREIQLLGGAKESAPKSNHVNHFEKSNQPDDDLPF